MKRSRGSRTILTIIVTVLVIACIAVILGVAIMFSGAISVAATTPDWPVVAWALNTTMENSVKVHARDVIVPADYNNLDVQAGQDHYSRMCVPCHGAPGVESEWMGQGLQPYPPDLTSTANDWTPAEVFWIINNGIKMTGMPAAGPSHSESEVWNLAAFVKSLPEVTPEQYRAHGQPAGGDDAERNRPSGELNQ